MNKLGHPIGRWISILYRYGQCYLGKKLEGYNIGSGQYGILMILCRNGGISQEELSYELKIDKGSIAKSVKKLEEEGYIERSTDQEDKRAYKVFPTQKTLDVMPVLQEAIDNWEEIITSDLSENEKEIIEQLLCKMANKACKKLK